MNNCDYIYKELDKACKQSDCIGLSGMDVYCFDKNNYIDEFNQAFLIDIEDGLFKQTDKTFRETMIDLLEKDIQDGFLKKVNDIIKSDTKVIRIDNSIVYDMLSGPSGLSPFFFLEDFFFVEGKDKMYCFMTGNNE